ncbi:hypothetical protein OGATHE_002460 [Ogataea polymorpha]|uniref:Copper transport protein n=1 Tax=Ogataea polymorpha TaxID=460523 RepID=A0A9P8T7X2_9ASCO|nr:hypothetical protein OGATHE_002460 [Ogataea polymorpha]
MNMDMDSSTSSHMDMSMTSATSSMAMATASPSSSMDMDMSMDMGMNYYLTTHYNHYPVIFHTLRASSGAGAFGIFCVLFFGAVFFRGLFFLSAYLEQRVFHNLTNAVLIQEIDNCACDPEEDKKPDSSGGTLRANSLGLGKIIRQTFCPGLGELKRDFIRLLIAFTATIFKPSTGLISVFIDSTADSVALTSSSSAFSSFLDSAGGISTDSSPRCTAFTSALTVSKLSLDVSTCFLSLAVFKKSPFSVLRILSLTSVITNLSCSSLSSPILVWNSLILSNALQRDDDSSSLVDKTSFALRQALANWCAKVFGV